MLLVLFTRQFLSFSCVFTISTALLTLLFTTSSFLCLNPLNPFRFLLLIIRFLTLQDFTIFSLSLIIQLPAVNEGKLLIQSLRWLFHNFSEAHHFTDHAKNNWKNPFCNMQKLW